MAPVNANHSAFLHAISAAAAAADAATADGGINEGAKPSDRARYHAIIAASRPSCDPLEEQRRLQFHNRCLAVALTRDCLLSGITLTALLAKPPIYSKHRSHNFHKYSSHIKTSLFTVGRRPLPSRTEFINFSERDLINDDSSFCSHIPFAIDLLCHVFPFEKLFKCPPLSVNGIFDNSDMTSSPRNDVAVLGYIFNVLVH